MWSLLGMAAGAAGGMFLGAFAGRPFGVAAELGTFGMMAGAVTGVGYFTVLFDNPPKLKPYPMFTLTFIYIMLGVGVAQIDPVANNAVPVGAAQKREVKLRRLSPGVLIAVALSSGSLGLLVGWDIRRRLRNRMSG